MVYKAGYGDCIAALEKEGIGSVDELRKCNIPDIQRITGYSERKSKKFRLKYMVYAAGYEDCVVALETEGIGSIEELKNCTEKDIQRIAGYSEIKSKKFQAPIPKRILLEVSVQEFFELCFGQCANFCCLYITIFE